jgi:hypothetical protein
LVLIKISFVDAGSPQTQAPKRRVRIRGIWQNALVGALVGAVAMATDWMPEGESRTVLERAVS